MRIQIQPSEAIGRTVEGYHTDGLESVMLLSGNAFVYTVATREGPLYGGAELATDHEFHVWLQDAQAWGIATDEEVELAKARYLAKKFGGWP